MISGHIALVSRIDEIVKRRKYHNRRRRDNILSDWRKQYGQSINKCYIQLIPDTNERINEKTGMNMGVKKQNL